MRIGSAAAVALVLAVPGVAGAYCQQTTEDEDTCQGGVGTPIAWPGPCQSYSIHADGTPDVPMGELRAAVRRSVNAWENATRTGDAAPCTDFSFAETDLATCDRVGYSRDCGNVNLVVFREEGWSHDHAAIALSTIFFTGRGAEIVSTDLELNGEDFRFAVRDDYAGCDAEPEGCPADLENTVTHEAGHFLGLSHVDDPEATMDFAEIPGDTNKRSLEADDVAGICDIYPAGGGGSCDPTPPHGLDLACAACERGCCSTAPGVPVRSAPPLEVAAGLLVAVGLLRRRS